MPVEHETMLGGDGLVTLSAIKLTAFALHGTPYPGTQRGKRKEDDRETRGVAI